LKSLKFDLSINGAGKHPPSKGVSPGLERETGMDRLFANGTVNAAQSGKGPPLFLFHSLLSDRASFDAIAPLLSQSFRVIVPELPGFGQSVAVSGGLAAVADRMAEVV
jgi:3-oxoadipate enol-lactonase